MNAYPIGATPTDGAPGAPDAREAHGDHATPNARRPPLRLALVSDTYAPDLNGVARTLEQVVAAVRARGGAARVFGPKASRRVVEGALRRWRPTLVHAATPFGPGIVGRRVARELELPFVTSYHTSAEACARRLGAGRLTAATWRYLRWFHNAGARTLCASRTVRDALAARGFANTAVWTPGVDAARFHPGHRSAALRAQLGAAEHAVVVAYVGRLAREKGLDVLLTAARRVARESTTPVVFAFAGAGPYEAVARRAAPRGAVFTGALDDSTLGAFYASADLLVFPSATETSGDVLLEAMASGVAILGVDAGPTPELLGNGCGAIVRSGDPAALALRLLSLVDAPDARRGFAHAALAAARARPWSTALDALIAEYHAIQAEHRATAVGGAR